MGAGNSRSRNRKQPQTAQTSHDESPGHHQQNQQMPSPTTILVAVTNSNQPSLEIIDTVIQQTPMEHLTLLSQTTPREDDIHISVPYTPVGDEASIYKYYCPLCMLYFKKILKGSCCGNYICMQCTVDYLHSKGSPSITDIRIVIEKHRHFLDKVNCPNCTTLGFIPVDVSRNDEVRDYSRRVPESSSRSAYYESSPLRAGESFEDLKRKMIPFKKSGTAGGQLENIADNYSTNNSNSNSAQNSPMVLLRNLSGARLNRESSFVAGIASLGIAGDSAVDDSAQPLLAQPAADYYIAAPRARNVDDGDDNLTRYIASDVTQSAAKTRTDLSQDSEQQIRQAAEGNIEGSDSVPTVGIRKLVFAEEDSVTVLGEPALSPTHWSCGAADCKDEAKESHFGGAAAAGDKQDEAKESHFGGAAVAEDKQDEAKESHLGGAAAAEDKQDETDTHNCDEKSGSAHNTVAAKMVNRICCDAVLHAQAK